MCGRYHLEDELIEYFSKRADRVEEELNKKEYNRDIYPSYKAPIIYKKDKKIVLGIKTWGYPGFKGKGLLINARCESVTNKRIFHNGISHNRIIVPASSYYEWNAAKEKVEILGKDGKPIFIAGFYDNFDGEDKFVILTTGANDSVKNVHHRMPLILDSKHIVKWLDDENWMTYLSYTPEELKHTQKIEQQSMLFLD